AQTCAWRRNQNKQPALTHHSARGAATPRARRRVQEKNKKQNNSIARGATQATRGATQAARGATTRTCRKCNFNATVLTNSKTT
ncbi:hypothetical protein A2U01_0084465, partial [Trifolium medium]|nr:hypothetical protein [Trifolium medium]